MERVDVIVVGAGIAGLCTAYQLVQAGLKSVLVLERDVHPRLFANDHPTATGRQLTGFAEHTALSVPGRKQLEDYGLLRTTGGMILGTAPGDTNALTDEADRFDVKIQRGSGSLLPGFDAVEYLRIPSDGVIDVDALLRFCAEEARYGGATFRFQCGVKSIHPVDDGFDVETSQEVIHARILVNAAGQDARELGRAAGGMDLELKSLPRHFLLGKTPHNPKIPWIGWTDQPFHLRPESGSLLFCLYGNDEENGPDGHQDRHARARLFRLLEDVAPSLAHFAIRRTWRCERVFAPDRRFVLGFDPLSPNLFWAAGLGDDGAIASLALGSRAAQAILAMSDTGPLSPRRFANAPSDPRLRW